MTAGLGQFGPASVSNLAKDLRIELSNPAGSALDEKTYSIEQVAERALGFFEHRYRSLQPQPANPHSFEFWVGGYGANNSRGEIWKLEIQDGDIPPIVQLAKAEDDDQLIWGGQIRAISRPILGCDPLLAPTLERKGLTKQDIGSITQPLATPLVHSSMPVQDAINLAQLVNRMRYLVTAAARQARSLAPGARPTRWNQLR